MQSEDGVAAQHQDTTIPPPGERAARQADGRPIGALFAELLNGLSTLIRQELRLAQAEGSEKLTRAAASLIAIVGGLLVAICALLVLLQALVIALAHYMPPAVASLVVGLVVAVIAFIMIWQGQRNLSAEKLAPKRTIRSLREDKEMVMEKAR
jgi:hypothetical protein